jgi:CHAT domain-containing protein
VLEGEVAVATTGATDSLSFARIQAGNTAGSRLLAEAYRRNNAGNYAEAAEFFSALAASSQSGNSRAEALTNEALQKSNLGSFAEAETLFEQASQLAGGDPVLLRQLRNQRAMHHLNRNRPSDALAELERPMAQAAAAPGASLASLVIDKDTAAELSSQSRGGESLGGFGQLTAQEKSRVLDAQALQLRGSTLRLQGKLPQAVAALTQAERELAAVRGGRLTSALWMRAQILSELAGVAEGQKDNAEADRHHLAGIQLLQQDAPGSPAWSNANGRYAAFLGRTGRGDEARTIFRAIVDANASSGGASPSLRQHLRTYFQLLTAPDAAPDAARDLFRASQLLTRPGVARTQAVLARELSGGSGEAARMFRQSLNQNREIERARVIIARLKAAPETPPERLAFAEAQLEKLRGEQIATQAKLAEFPQFRAVAAALMTAQDMQALLTPGEAYVKLIVMEETSYAVLVTPEIVRAVPVAITAQYLEEEVTALRASIIHVEDGQTITHPFEVAAAHQLYKAFFAPFRQELAAVKHLIFEPDGAMLRLPANLLVEEEASVLAYQARAKEDVDAAFDFRGVAWMGRQREISTALSASAFRDVRRIPPSQARFNYIGFGENAPLDAAALSRPSVRSATAGEGCSWSEMTWNQPISAKELLLARNVFSIGAPGSAEVVTGEQFTDDQIEERDDLQNYRIVHFATHGLLMPPRPECPARPSLLTSFGSDESDGLLSFNEIFNLKLDADIVILSACDTAGQASMAANLDAGITNGGSFTFDGLVRAFVGAGGRMVLASHWPLPDDFDATQKLISGLLAAPPGTSTGAALLAAQRTLMDDMNTSHPFYWAAFAIVGDGVKPVFREAPQARGTH